MNYWAILNRLLLCFLFSIAFSIAYGQDTTRTLRPVQIFDSKDSSLRIVNLNTVAPSYEMNRLKLRSLGENDLGAALKYIPGVQVRDYGGAGGIRTVSYRSTGATHTATCQDGILTPATQTGTVNLSSFDIFGMNQVSFTTGAPQQEFLSASSYVLPNLINVRSGILEQADSVELELYTSASTIAVFEHGLLFRTPLIKSRMWMGVQGLVRYGEGDYPFLIENSGTDVLAKRTNADLISYRLKGAFGYKWKRSRLELAGGYYNNDQQLPGAVILYNPESDQSLKTETIQAQGIFYHYRTISSLRTHLSFQSDYTGYYDPDYLNAAGFIQANYQQFNGSGGVMYHIHPGNKKRNYFFGTDAMISSLDGSEIDSNPFRLQLNSVGGADVKLLNSRLNLSANLTHQFIQDQRIDGEETSVLNYSKFSPYAGLNYRISNQEMLRLRMFYKSSFRMPSFNDLYYNFIGNIGLKPEKTSQFNTGFTFAGKIKNFSAEMTGDVYMNQVKDKIVAIPTKNIFVWSMQNIGEVDIRGIDLSGTFTVSYGKSQWSLLISQNINQSLDVTDEESPSYRHQIPYTPVHSAQYSLNFMRNGFSVSANMIYCGSRYSLNENIASNYMQSFTDLGIQVGQHFTLTKGAQMNVRILAMNIFNRNYQVIRSFPMPGRHYKLSFNIEL